MKPGVHKLNHSRAMYRVAVVGCGGTGASLVGDLKSPIRRSLGNALTGSTSAIRLMAVNSCWANQRTNRNRRTPRRLPTVAELFPEIVKPALDKDDDLPSCSAIEALEKQEPFVNQTLAYHSLAMLARLFKHGSITHYGGFLSLGSGYVAPLPSRSL